MAIKLTPDQAKTILSEFASFVLELEGDDGKPNEPKPLNTWEFSNWDAFDYPPSMVGLAARVLLERVAPQKGK